MPGDGHEMSGLAAEIFDQLTNHNRMLSRAVVAEGEVERLRGALLRLTRAVEKLGQVKNGKTLFEGSPETDPECFTSWVELHDAHLQARAALAGKVEG